MRHFLLPALALPLIAATSPAIEKPVPRPGTSEPACPGNGFALVKEGGKPEIKRLGELPSGSLVLTVLLEEDGCAKPLVVRQGFGESGGGKGADPVPERSSARR